MCFFFFFFLSPPPPPISCKLPLNGKHLEEAQCLIGSCKEKKKGKTVPLLCLFATCFVLLFSGVERIDDNVQKKLRERRMNERKNRGQRAADWKVSNLGGGAGVWWSGLDNVQCVVLNKVIRPSLDALMPLVCLCLTQKQGQASGLIRQQKWQLAHCTLMNAALIIRGGPGRGWRGASGRESLKRFFYH